MRRSLLLGLLALSLQPLVAPVAEPTSAAVARLRDLSALAAPRNHTDARLVHAEFLRRAGEIRRLYRTAPTELVAPPAWRAAALAAQPAADAPMRTFCPADFGADPAGLADSTEAVLRAVDSMLAECAAPNGTAAPGVRPMAAGVSDCGGAVLDLRGGQYLISAPVVIPPHYGNLNVNSGTLRATPTFPANRSLVELGAGLTTNGVEFVNFHEVLFDASHVAAGGLQIADCIGVTVEACFFVGFSGIGISVIRGHETMISNTWLAESYWNEPWNSSESHSVGIRLAANDAYVKDVIVFMHTLYGLQQRGGANLIDGVHAWNAGGTPTTGDNPMPWVRSDLGAGISITSDGAQSRLVNNYLDGSLLIIADPVEVVVTDTFFINAYTVLVSGKPIIRNFEMRANTYVCPSADSPACLGTRTVHTQQSEGNPAAPHLRPNFTRAVTGFVSVTDELVMPPNVTDLAERDIGTVTTTTARLSLTMSKEFTFELGSRLLFGWIDTVSYEVTIDMPPPAAFTPHRARTPVGTTVTVDFAEPVNATVTLTATQGLGETMKVKTDDAALLIDAHCSDSLRIRIAPPGMAVQKDQVGALSEECGTDKRTASPAARLVGAGGITNGDVRAVVTANHLVVSRVSDGMTLLSGPLPSFADAECGSEYRRIGANFTTGGGIHKWYGMGQLASPAAGITSGWDHHCPDPPDPSMPSWMSEGWSPSDGPCAPPLDRAQLGPVPIRSVKYWIGIPWQYNRQGWGLFLNQPGEGVIDVSSGLSLTFSCQKQLDMWISVSDSPTVRW